jgi:hypothetical protein
MRKLPLLILICITFISNSYSQTLRFGVISLFALGESREPILRFTNEGIRFDETNWDIKQFGGAIEINLTRNFPLIWRLQLTYGKHNDILLVDLQFNKTEKIHVSQLLVDSFFLYHYNFYKMLSLNFGIALGITDTKFTNRIIEKNIYTFEEETIHKNETKDIKFTYGPSFELSLKVFNRFNVRAGVLYRIPQVKYKILRGVYDPQSSQEPKELFAESKIDQLQFLGGIFFTF